MRVEPLKLAKSKNEDLIFYYYNFDPITFKSLSDTHGGLLNHVQKEILKYSNSFMVSVLSSLVAPLPFMIFDISISKALAIRNLENGH